MTPRLPAADRLAIIREHLATPGNFVQVCTAYKATVYGNKHRGMFAVHGTSLDVQRGNRWDCIDYCAVRFGHWRAA